MENVIFVDDDMGRERNMYISFWLNRYQTNKNNAARKWRNMKKFHMIYNRFENHPIYFSSLSATELFTRRSGESRQRRMKKNVPSMEREINHFGAIKKIGCFCGNCKKICKFSENSHFLRNSPVCHIHIVFLFSGIRIVKRTFRGAPFLSFFRMLLFPFTSR